MEALRLARHKQFGASSEKISEGAMEQLSFLFNEAEACAEEEAEEQPAPETSRKKHKYTLENIPEGTPKEVVEHRLEGEDLVCPECGEICKLAHPAITSSPHSASRAETHSPQARRPWQRLPALRR